MVLSMATLLFTSTFHPPCTIPQSSIIWVICGWVLVEYEDIRESKISLNWSSPENVSQHLDTFKNGGRPLDLDRSLVDCIDTIEKLVNGRMDAVLMFTNGKSCRPGRKDGYELISATSAGRVFYIIHVNNANGTSCVEQFEKGDYPKSVIELEYADYKELSENVGNMEITKYTYHVPDSNALYKYKPSLFCYYSPVTGQCIRHVQADRLYANSTHPPAIYHAPCSSVECERLCDDGWPWDNWTMCQIGQENENWINMDYANGTKMRWRERTPPDDCRFSPCETNETMQCDLREESYQLFQHHFPNITCQEKYRKKNRVAEEMAVFSIAAGAITLPIAGYMFCYKKYHFCLK